MGPGETLPLYINTPITLLLELASIKCTLRHGQEGFREDVQFIMVVQSWVLLRQFLPDSYEKYAAAQFRMTKAYRQYYSWVPEFLHLRPCFSNSRQPAENKEL